MTSAAHLRSLRRDVRGLFVDAEQLPRLAGHAHVVRQHGIAVGHGGVDLPNIVKFPRVAIDDGVFRLRRFTFRQWQAQWGSGRERQKDQRLRTNSAILIVRLSQNKYWALRRCVSKRVIPASLKFGQIHERTELCGELQRSYDIRNTAALLYHTVYSSSMIPKVIS